MKPGKQAFASSELASRSELKQKTLAEGVEI